MNKRPINSEPTKPRRRPSGDLVLALFRTFELKWSLMASSGPSSSATANKNAKVYAGFTENAFKYKHNFIQFFAVTGILLLSVRSLGQKYRIHDLEEDTAALKKEGESITARMRHIKQSLLHEASIESTGLFTSRLRSLFGKDD